MCVNLNRYLLANSLVRDSHTTPNRQPLPDTHDQLIPSRQVVPGINRLLADRLFMFIQSDGGLRRILSHTLLSQQPSYIVYSRKDSSAHNWRISQTQPCARMVLALTKEALCSNIEEALEDMLKHVGALMSVPSPSVSGNSLRCFIGWC